MSEPENFVSRWSRLKRESESRRKRQTELSKSAALSGAAVTTPADEDEPVDTGTHAPTFDPTSLPSIDSITAGSDIRIFLQSGVPAKLTEAALRRAWVSDPAIRDFIGIAENQWDFTNPTSIPGFGPLQEASDKLSLIAQAAGSLDKLSAPVPDTHASDKPESATRDSRRDEIENTAHETQAALATRAIGTEMSNTASENGRVAEAAKNNLSLGSTSSRRRRHAHGGALPR